MMKTRIRAYTENYTLWLSGAYLSIALNVSKGLGGNTHPLTTEQYRRIASEEQYRRIASDANPFK